MKAIIISDESQTIASIKENLEFKGFDTIVYRWLLKALDNIEEIQPDLVIVSTSEYPRHWKTLTQFITSGIGGDTTVVILYTQNKLSEEDKEKAEALGVKGFFSNTSPEGLKTLDDILDSLYQDKLKPETQNENTEPDVSETPLISNDAEIKDENEGVTESSEILTIDIPSEIDETKESDKPDLTFELFENDDSEIKEEEKSPEETTEDSFLFASVDDDFGKAVSEPVPSKKYDEGIPTVSEIISNKECIFNPDSAALLFNHPVTGKIVTGKVLSYQDETVIFQPEDFVDISSINAGMKINPLVFEINNETFKYSAVIENADFQLIIKFLEKLNG